MRFTLPLLSQEELGEVQHFHRNTSASLCEAYFAGNPKK